MNGRPVLCPPPGSCQIGENVIKKANSSPSPISFFNA